MVSFLLIPALLLAGGPPAAEPKAPLATTAPAADDAFEALAAEYDKAVADWRAAIDATEDKRERAELRRNPPAHAFWPRFEALAEGGDGHATLWLATHLKDKGVKASERGAIAQGHYETLFAKHVEADWFAEVVEALAAEDRIASEAKAVHFRRAMEAAKAERAKGLATFSLALLMLEADATRAEGEDLLRIVAERYALTEYGMTARGMLLTEADLEVGKVAPDFAGKTIDGFEFKLSDYRGKVVLVDFYGFW